MTGIVQKYMALLPSSKVADEVGKALYLGVFFFGVEAMHFF